MDLSSTVARAFEHVAVEERRVRLWRGGVSHAAADLPILALHGWGASIEAVLPAVSQLSASTTVIVPDLPGHGGSDPLPPEGWDAHDFARWARLLLDELGIPRAHVLGHSRGGAVGVCLAADEPTRVGRLLLCASAGLKPRRRAGWYGRVGIAKAGRVAAALGGERGDACQEWLRSRIASRDWLDAPESSRATLRKLFAQDLSQEMRGVLAPTLLVWGSDDRDTPLWMGTRMEELIPDSGLVVLPGAGHFAYADDLPRFRVLAEHFLVEQPRAAARSDAEGAP